jgi:hypothetical protein
MHISFNFTKISAAIFTGIAIVNQFAPFIPAKYQATTVTALSATQAALQILAHLSPSPSQTQVINNVQNANGILIDQLNKAENKVLVSAMTNTPVPIESVKIPNPPITN